MSETSGAVLTLLVMLVLPVSALAARRVPVTTTVKYGALWCAILLTGWLIAAYFT